MHFEKKHLFLVLYFIIAAVHLFMGQMPEVSFLSKIALIPALAAWLWFNDIDKAYKKLLFLALFFSWIGDLLLGLQSINSNFFIFGLLAFLSAHCFYISLNLKNIGFKISIPIILATLPMLGWAAYLLKMSHEKAGGFFIPIIAYAFILCMLYYSTIIAREKFSRMNWAILFYGVVLFISSDSMIAINKFIVKMPFFDFAIMFTYIIAQFMIVFSYLRNFKR
ncbi:MAG: lysoplasmalogenase [Caulobacterales bacterium]|nr:lysoplasmalogenase [Caulobacterales bacterium]MCA0373297.1 lysoplasmalogenase [Pseudomonadota bacterium]